MEHTGDTMQILVAGTSFAPMKGYLARHFPKATVTMVPLAEVMPYLPEADILFPTMSRIDERIFAHAPKLRLVQQWGAGLEGVDIEAASRYGVPVANVPTAGTGNAESVAEWCVMMALCLGRQFPGIQAQVHAGQPWGAPAGQTLLGRCAGILGFGGIGQALATRLRAFGMRVAAIKRRPDDQLRQSFGLEWLGGVEDRAHLLAQAEYLFVCVPLTPETRNFLGADEFAQLQPGAFLINAARGAIVHHDALLDALNRGQLGGAALDVFWQEPPDPKDPIIAHPRILMTPHIGGVTDVSYTHIAEHAAYNIRQVMAGELPRNCANADALRTLRSAG